MILRIRKEQMNELIKYMSRQFKYQKLEHLKKFFPKEIKGWSEAECYEIISEGIHQAKGYGITIERDVSKFIDLMVRYGSDFAQNPLYPKACQILSESTTIPSRKIRRLLEYLQKATPAKGNGSFPEEFTSLCQ